MKLSNVRPFLLSACFLLAVAIVAALLSGCDGNHIIGDLPTCVELVTDECVPEIIEEFCEPVEECETCEVCEPAEECETCETCEVCEDQCVEPVDCDDYPDWIPRGHLPKECRGKGPDKCERVHVSTLGCDKNCAPHDPICIPCDLGDFAGLLAQHCETVCTPLPGGGVSCIQTCYDRTGRRV